MGILKARSPCVIEERRLELMWNEVQLKLYQKIFFVYFLIYFSFAIRLWLMAPEIRKKLMVNWTNPTVTVTTRLTKLRTLDKTEPVEEDDNKKEPTPNTT